MQIVLQVINLIDFIKNVETMGVHSALREVQLYNVFYPEISQANLHYQEIAKNSRTGE